MRFSIRSLTLAQTAEGARVNLKNLIIISLVSFGLFLPTSATAQKDERQSFPQVSTTSPHGVDLQTGRFTKQGVDLVIGPLTVDHYVQRKMPAAAGGIIDPYVFTTSLHGHSNQYVSGSTVYENVYIGNLKLTFNALSNGTFFPLDSANTGWKMVRNGTQFVLTSKSGDTYLLDTHPGISSSYRRLTSMTSANGHKLTYTYDSSARLISVKSNRGYAVVLQYSGNNVIVCGFNRAITQMPASCSGAALKVTYGRDGAGKLTSITALDGAVTNIQYVTWQGGTYISCVTLPNSSTCAIQNGYTGIGSGGTNSDQVTSQTTANGEVWNYTHIPIENNPGDYTPYPGEILQSFSWMYPPVGGGTSAVFGNGFVQTLKTPEGTTSYEYSTNGAYQVAYSTHYSIHYYSMFPSRITYPGGNSSYFTRDWADNVTGRADIARPGSGLANNVTVWEYPAAYKWSSPTICAAANVLCDKPTKVTDPNGNVTDFTYSATHGGMLTKTEAAVNGIRPQTRYTYVQRYARDVNGTALQPPVWVLASEEYCKTTAASGSGCAGGASDEVVTTYDYGPTTGPNNLLLRGKVVDPTGLNLRTCYTYDQYGRKISETQPLGTGSTCP